MLLTYKKLGAWRWVLNTISVAVALFLLLPIIFIVALSFGSSRWLAFPPPHWTTKWYAELFADPTWMESAFVSLKVSSVVMILSVVLGYLASVALVRGCFRGREFLRALLLTPMMLPVVVLGIALYAFFLKSGLNGSYFAFVISHLLIALPFSVIVISNALELFDPAIENAAVLCGATPWQARIKVTIPAIKNGLISAAIFSFLISWDDVVLAIFMASPDLQTLPVKIWGTLRQDLTPVVAAASTLLTAITICFMFAIGLLMRKRK